MTQQKKHRFLSLWRCLLYYPIAGCNPKPEKITFGKDNCAECKMTIMDPKFGGEIVTKKGKCSSLMIHIVWRFFWNAVAWN